jgi:peptidoglycan/xylan/chitin deacetylase (PgdA/CDA1 family)
MRDWTAKLKRRWTRLWIKPIRVFCFHQVSDVFDPDTMKECDWMQTEDFKKKILEFKQQYTFVSLEEAYSHIADDRCRLKRYAVLTADDGWASLKSILPWLEEQQVPVTLFLNPFYMDGAHFREMETERYLLESDIRSISDTYSGVSVGMHGWEHLDASKQSEDEFRKNVEQSIQALKGCKSFVPFFAYPWGRRNGMTDRVLKEFDVVPVLMDRMRNYNDASVIHRELLTD